MQLLLLFLSALPASQPPETLVDSINQERGGRHWIDQQTAPPLSPGASAAEAPDAPPQPLR